MGNGCWNPVPGGNIYDPSVPNGTYGVIIPPFGSFGSFGNSNTTPQISGQTVTKGNGYVRVENKETGQYAVYNTFGQYMQGNY